MSRDLFCKLLQRIILFNRKNASIYPLKFLQTHQQPEGGGAEVGVGGGGGEDVMVLIFHWIHQTVHLNYHKNHEKLIVYILEMIISLSHNQPINQRILGIEKGMILYLQELLLFYLNYLPSEIITTTTPIISSSSSSAPSPSLVSSSSNLPTPSPSSLHPNNPPVFFPPSSSSGRQSFSNSSSAAPATASQKGPRMEIQSSSRSSPPQSFPLHELILQTFDNLLLLPENKRLFSSTQKDGLLIEYLTKGYQLSLSSMISSFPSPRDVRSSFTSSSAAAAAAVTDQKPSPCGLKIIENALTCIVHLIENDQYYCTLFTKNTEHIQLFLKIFDTFASNHASLAELACDLFKNILLSQNETFTEILYKYQIPTLLMNIAKNHGPYHSHIAEISIQILAYFTDNVKKLELISNSAIGGLAGIHLIISTLEQQEVNNPMIGQFAITALLQILKADEQKMTKKHSNLYFSFDYSNQVLLYALEMMIQHHKVNYVIVEKGNSLLHLLTSNDIEIWKIIAQHKGIEVIIQIISDLLHDPNARVVIEHLLETLLEFVKDEELIEKIKTLIDIQLLNDLLRHHGKYSLSLLRFVINHLMYLYPTRAAEQLNKPDQITCELLMELYHYFRDRYEQHVEARKIFSVSFDMQESSKQLGLVVSNTSNEEDIAFRALGEDNDYLSSLICLDTIIMLSSFPINHSIFIQKNFLFLLMKDLRKKLEDSIPSSFPLSRENPFLESSSLSEKDKMGLSLFPSQREQSVNVQHVLYFIKGLTILKNFLLIQNHHKRLIKEGIIKIILLPFLEYYALLDQDLCSILLNIISLLSANYKLILGQFLICEYVIHLLVYYNNIFEAQEQEAELNPLTSPSIPQLTIHDLTPSFVEDLQSQQNQSQRKFIHNDIAVIGSNCIVNLTLHVVENKENFLNVKEISFPTDDILIQDFNIILYLQLLLKNKLITNPTRLEIKEAINILKFDN